MRNLMIGIMLTLLLIMGVTIILTIDDKSIRKNEVELSLENALTESINVIDKNKYSIDNTEELISDITQGLLSQIESDSTITIRILDVDWEKGIVSVEAVEKFKRPTNKEGTVSAVRTVILENEKEDSAAIELENKQYSISFILADGKQYISYCIKNGEKLIEPAVPDPDFKYWECDGQKLENIHEIAVSSDMVIREVK